MSTTTPGPDHAAGNPGPRRPELIVFDVNETLSDMSPLAGRFEDVGADTGLAGAWFAGLLRDGFALTIAHENPSFATLAADGLRTVLAGSSLNRSLDQSVEHIIGGISELGTHPDVAGGVRALAALGIRLVTLSNGSASIARQLMTDAALVDAFEAFLSVEQAARWKPAPEAYAFALETCGVEPARAMLVASHPWDTDGAKRAGLSTAWLNRNQGRYPEYFRAPDLEVAALDQLATRL